MEFKVCFRERILYINIEKGKSIKILRVSILVDDVELWWGSKNISHNLTILILFIYIHFLLSLFIFSDTAVKL